MVRRYRDWKRCAWYKRLSKANQRAYDAHAERREKVIAKAAKHMKALIRERALAKAVRKRARKAFLKKRGLK
jgi:hypothetical protein